MSCMKTLCSGLWLLLGLRFILCFMSWCDTTGLMLIDVLLLHHGAKYWPNYYYYYYFWLKKKKAPLSQTMRFKTIWGISSEWCCSHLSEIDLFSCGFRHDLQSANWLQKILALVKHSVSTPHGGICPKQIKVIVSVLIYNYKGFKLFLSRFWVKKECRKLLSHQTQTFLHKNTQSLISLTSQWELPLGCLS